MERVGLQPARYIQAAAYRTISRYRDMKCHDISISLLGYDMITKHDRLYLYCSVTDPGWSAAVISSGHFVVRTRQTET